MKQTINFRDFKNAFDNLRPDNFSVDALQIMFEYFEEYERDIGEEIEFDPIGICCEYVEEYPQEIVKNYKLENDINGMDQDEMIKYIENYLLSSCIFIGITDSGSFVYQQF